MKVADRDDVGAVGVGVSDAGPAGIEAVTLLVHRLDPDLDLPRYAQPGDAGVDLYSRDETFLEPGARALVRTCLLYTSPSPRDRTRSRMPSSA